MHIDKENMILDDDYMWNCYSEFRNEAKIEPLGSLEREADRIQKAKGKLPLFDYSGEYDNDDWYEFYFKLDGDKVTDLEFIYGLGGYTGDVIEIDEQTKRSAEEMIKEWRDKNLMREITEVCPHCDSENQFMWDVEKDGYIAKCTSCGNEMCLCDECLHADDNPDHKCDWREENDMSVCFRGKHSM